MVCLLFGLSFSNFGETLPSKLWDELNFAAGKPTQKEIQKRDDEFLADNLETKSLNQTPYKEDVVSLKLAAPMRKNKVEEVVPKPKNRSVIKPTRLRKRIRPRTRARSR